jgi:hypothetical protein
MPSAPDNHDAHNYAERIRERLRRRLQELRERCGVSKYGLARESGLSRGYVAERRAVMPGLCWVRSQGFIEHRLISAKPPVSPNLARARKNRKGTPVLSLV